MMEQNNNKGLVYSIIAVVALVVLVAGGTFALFSFTGTGATANAINSGTVSMSYVESSGVINISDAYPMTDARGLEYDGAGNVLTFTVGAEIDGTMTIKYDLGFDFTGITNTLAESNVKYHLTKNGTPVSPATATTGTLVSTRAAVAGTNNLIPSYAISSGMFTTSGTDSYVLKFWIDENYELAGGAETDVAVGTCVDGANTDYNVEEADCVSPGVWTETGTSHQKGTEEKEFSAKLKVVGAQFRTE